MSSDRRLRIVYVWDADYPWDVRTEKTCRALTEGGHHVTIAARNRARKPVVEDLAEGRVRRMPPMALVGARIDRALSFPAFVNPRWTSLVRHCVDTDRAEVIIVRDLPLAPLAIWAGRRAGIPVILDMAENYPAMIRDVWASGRHSPADYLLRNPGAVEWVERYVLPRVDHVVTVVEESAARVIAMGVPPARVSVVSNTPPVARVVPEGRPVRPGPLRLVYLGLMEVPRGILEVLDAVVRLGEAGRAVELDLIGGGRDLDLFRARAATLGLQAPTVRFHGQLANAEALRLVGEADVGLVPHHALESWNTTIPNKLFDYMAAGLPVVSSDAVPAARVVRDTRCGVVFRSGDGADLARQIGPLFEPARRAEASIAGRAAIRAQYNWERDAGVLLRILDSTVRAG